MKAFITLADKTVCEVETDLSTIMEMGAHPGCSVFIPACLCGSTHVCRQHGVKRQSVTHPDPFRVACSNR